MFPTRIGNKCKNHFNEMKGDAGMSLHEKEGNKKNLHFYFLPSHVGRTSKCAGSIPAHLFFLLHV